MSFHVSSDLSVWIAAFLTLCIFSFLYKDNPFYKFAEHLFVGVSAGYYMILNFWTVLVPNLAEPLKAAALGRGVVEGRHGMFAASLGDYRGYLLIPALLGLLLFTRLLGRIGWMSRWPLALVIGAYAGLQTTGFAQGDLVAQIEASMQSVNAGSLAASINVIVFTIGLITSLLFFFYSREPKGTFGIVSRVGMSFLMVGFGAGYAYTVMSRVSLLIGRFQFLVGDWLGLR